MGKRKRFPTTTTIYGIPPFPFFIFIDGIYWASNMCNLLNKAQVPPSSTTTTTRKLDISAPPDSNGITAAEIAARRKKSGNPESFPVINETRKSR